MSSRPSNSQSKSSSRPVQVPDSLICRVRFNNTLPDIPFDPKFLVNPLDIQRYVPYKTTSLEQNAKHELLTSFDLGVDINLILPERYAIHPGDLHEEDDEKLLRDDDVSTPGSANKRNPRDNPHSALHNKIVPWLKKTEYISTEFNRYGASSEKTETKVGYNVRKKMKEDAVFMDRDSQIQAIDRTFEAARRPIDKHHSKPNVVPVKVTPLLPDFEMWKYPFAQVVFDNEPSDLAKGDQMAQAIIRGMADEDNNDQFVAYFLPTEITMAERLIDQSNNRDYTEDKEYEYKLTREYNWNFKTTQGYEENYFFVFRDDAVYYNSLETRVKLNKRRIKSQRNLAESTLIVKHRPLNEQEIRTQEIRMAQLDPPQIDEDMNVSGAHDSANESSQDQQKSTEIEQTPMAINFDQRPSVGEDRSSEGDSSSSSSSTSSSSSSSSDSSSDDDDDDNDDVKGKLSKEIFGSDDSE